ncbi:hypothetical protein Ct61P_15141 [Colletotrichum tofieldiae]|nr:hypothetical protein Ct61P_15141 [Colletotrichum tofieldiae]
MHPLRSEDDVRVHAIAMVLRDNHCCGDCIKHDLINTANYHQFPTDENLAHLAGSFAASWGQVAAWQVHNKKTNAGGIANYRARGINPKERDINHQENIHYLRNTWLRWHNGLLEDDRKFNADQVQSMVSVAKLWLGNVRDRPLSDFWVDDGIMNKAIQASGGCFTVKSAAQGLRDLKKHLGIVPRAKPKKTDSAAAATKPPETSRAAANVTTNELDTPRPIPASPADALEDKPLSREPAATPALPKDAGINFGAEDTDPCRLSPLLRKKELSPPLPLPGSNDSDSECSVDGILAHMYSRVRVPLVANTSKFRVIRAEAGMRPRFSTS